MPIGVLAVTNRCQQRCVFCIEGRSQCERAAALDLPFAVVARLLREVRKVSGGVVYMGGETALHPDFIRILERSVRLGLKPILTTNLQRFADADFLERCVEAGLHSVECSFHHPDARSFSEATQTSPRNFDRLIKALENLKAMCERPRASWFGACVNIVIQRHNVERLDEVLSLLRRSLGGAFRIVHFKRLYPVTLGARYADIDPSLAPDPRKLRASLLRLLNRWDLPGTLPVLRDFPLCVAPGFAHLNADLVYHCRRISLVSNRGHWERLSATAEYGPLRLSSELPPGCDRCRLNGLCLTVTKGMTASTFGLLPEPSMQAPKDVLRAAGLGPGESASFIARCAASLAEARRALPAATAARPEFAPETAALQRRLSRLLLSRPAPRDFAGFRVSLVAVPAGARVVVVSLFRREPGTKRIEQLLIEVAQARGRGAPCFRRVGDLSVSYRAATPLDSDGRRAALAAFLECLRRRRAIKGTAS
ncbi:MAG: radical SAM protein [Elusimicrobiota bacterium]